MWLDCARVYRKFYIDSLSLVGNAEVPDNPFGRVQIFCSADMWDGLGSLLFCDRFCRIAYKAYSNR